MPAKTNANPPPAKARVSAARAAAFRILVDLSRSLSTHSDDLLHGAGMDTLSAQDRNLCTALTMGILRWQLVLDEEIAPLLMHKSRLDDPVRIALRLGAFQLLFLDRIPAHAAISESVELTKRAGHRFASGLVNAVLRKLAANGRRVAFDAKGAHPRWLTERWAEIFTSNELDTICSYDQQPPPATLRLVSSAAEAALLEEGFQLEAGAFLASARHVVAGDIAGSSVLRSGDARVQDEGSQLIAELFCGGVERGLNILDCCAAPGGKTAILAERHTGSRLLALDVSAERVAKMHNLFQGKPSLAAIETRTLDATALTAIGQFDRILCDVPCSGTGTLARNPEIKLRLQPDELIRQQSRQIAILQSAIGVLAPGGELIYSTCSLESEENEQVIQAVLADTPLLKLLPVGDRLRQLTASCILHAEGERRLIAGGLRGDFLRTLPGVSPTDGFFAAILKRT